MNQEVPDEARKIDTPEADPDAVRLRNWIAEHRKTCPVMRQSFEELKAVLAEEMSDD